MLRQIREPVILEPKEANMKKRGLFALVAGLAAVATVALMLVLVVIPGGTEGVDSPQHPIGDTFDK